MMKICVKIAFIFLFWTLVFTLNDRESETVSCFSGNNKCFIRKNILGQYQYSVSPPIKEIDIKKAEAEKTGKKILYASSPYKTTLALNKQEVKDLIK